MVRLRNCLRLLKKHPEKHIEVTSEEVFPQHRTSAKRIVLSPPTKLICGKKIELHSVPHQRDHIYSAYLTDLNQRAAGHLVLFSLTLRFTLTLGEVHTFWSTQPSIEPYVSSPFCNQSPKKLQRIFESPIFKWLYAMCFLISSQTAGQFTYPPKSNDCKSNKLKNSSHSHALVARTRGSYLLGGS